MENIVMVYKTNDDFQNVEALVTFLQSAGINVMRSPHSVVASALDMVNGTCLFVEKAQEAEAKILIDEFFNSEPNFVDMPDELKEEEYEEAHSSSKVKIALAIVAVIILIIYLL